MSVSVSRCTSCQARFHPQRDDCTACGAPTSKETIGGRGKVASWTKVARPPAGFEAPQRVVLVEIVAEGEADGVLVYAQTDTDELLETARAAALDEAKDGTVTARPIA